MTISVDGNESAAPGGEMVVLMPGSCTMQLGTEFRPINHPIEPGDNDQPVKCPLPEPSIVNDGRIWRERLAEGTRRKANIPLLIKEGATTVPHSPQTMVRKRHQPAPHRHHHLLSSFSAPEHNII